MIQPLQHATSAEAERYAVRLREIAKVARASRNARMAEYLEFCAGQACGGEDSFYAGMLQRGFE